MFGKHYNYKWGTKDPGAQVQLFDAFCTILQLSGKWLSSQWICCAVPQMHIALTFDLYNFQLRPLNIIQCKLLEQLGQQPLSRSCHTGKFFVVFTSYRSDGPSQAVAVVVLHKSPQLWSFTSYFSHDPSQATTVVVLQRETIRRKHNSYFDPFYTPNTIHSSQWYQVPILWLCWRP